MRLEREKMGGESLLNMKRLLPTLLLAFASCVYGQGMKTGAVEKLVEEKKNDQLRARSLFNGKDLSGWHVDVPKADDGAKVDPSFIVRDGNLVSLGTPRGHLITDQVFQNFRLSFEYRFAGKPGNCGVLIHSSTPRALFGMFPASIEVQMQSGHAGDFWCIDENIEVPNMAERRPKKAKQEWGGKKGDARRILNLTDGSEKAVGEWNAMVVEARGNEIKVWVNGDLVNHGAKCTVSKGQIALQAEGSEVEFKGLSLAPLSQKQEEKEDPKEVEKE